MLSTIKLAFGLACFARSVLLFAESVAICKLIAISDGLRLDSPVVLGRVAGLRICHCALVTCLEPSLSTTVLALTRSTKVMDGPLTQQSCVDPPSISHVGIPCLGIPSDNAVPVVAWTGDDPSDDELLRLVPFLTALTSVSDVRSILHLRSSPLSADVFPL